MRNRIKTFFSWCLVLFVLFASVFSPFIVFATSVSDAQNANRYDELAEILYLAKIADACNPKANDSDALPFSGSDSTVEARNKLKNFYNLNFTYDKTTLYDSYLEVLGQGSYDNGSVYCKQVRENVNVVPRLLDKLGLYNTSELPNIACGRNNEGGLFKIRMGYYCGGLGCDRWGPDGSNANGQWPENWPTATNDGYANDCKAAFDKVRYFTEENTSATISTSSTRFEVKFEINDNFRFQDYLSDYIGDYSSISNELTQANQYLNLMSSCNVTEETESKYKANIENGAEEGKQFMIYHDGQIKYIILGAPNRSVYWNQPGSSLTSENQSTCKQLAEALSPDSITAQNLIDNEKLGQINSCYTAATENASTLKRVGTFVRVIWSSSETLYRRAEGVLASETYGAITFDPVRYSADYMEQYARELTKDKNDDTLPIPSALEGFINASRGFEEKVRAYYEKLKDGKFTDEEKEDLQAEIDNYSSNINTFKEDVLDRVDDALGRIPEFNMDSVQIYGPVQAGQSRIINKVDGFYEFDDEGNFTCIATEEILPGLATEIENITGADISMTEYVPPNRDIYDDDSRSPEQDPCYNAGVEGMSWILCPALNNMVGTADLLTGVLDKWLAIDAGYYNDTSSAREAWGYFRDIANIAVIIVLLVVIVSQVTGYGIDNYGIKKILPRLLVMAVLINLSFLICQIAIDVSNLLGSGLNTMFQEIGLRINSEAGVTGFIAGVVDSLFAVLGIAGAGAGLGITIATFALSGGAHAGVMVVILLVLVVLSALLAVLMFFLALGLRFIIIIIFAAISPLAFACFILPNTQSLFKKWWDIFKTALIVYPICGALYGISFIVRGIIFKTGTGPNAPGVNFWLAMIGIAAPFLPFLVLPTLTKGAIAGLGIVGGALSGLKGSLKSGFSKGQSALQNTEAYKAQQEKAQRALNARMAGFKVKRGEVLRNDDGSFQTNDKMRGFGRFLRGGDAGMAAAKKRVLADERARLDEQNMTGAGFLAGLAGIQAGADSQRDANAEAMLSYGKATYIDDDGNMQIAQAGSLDSLGAYHRAALKKYHNAGSDDERAAALAEIRASQKMLSRVDAGRGIVQQNLTDAVKGGYGKGLKDASMHLQSDFGDLYKLKNRGANLLINDMAGGMSSAEIGSRIDQGVYALAGADKYDQSTLAGADDMALENMVNAVGGIRAKIANGQTVSDDEMRKFEQIQNTAVRAIDMYNEGHLSIKPEALTYIEEIAGKQASGSVLSVDHSDGAPTVSGNIPQTLSVNGANGKTITISRQGGKWFDEHGQELEGLTDSNVQEILNKRRDDMNRTFGGS